LSGASNDFLPFLSKKVEDNKRIVPIFETSGFVPIIGTKMQKTIYSPEYSHLLNWLRSKRHERGISMRELGEKLEIHHSWVGKIEQGERRLDIVEYLRVCNALEIDPHEGLTMLEKYNQP